MAQPDFRNSRRCLTFPLRAGLFLGAVYATWFVLAFVDELLRQGVLGEGGVVARAHPDQPLMIHCELCGDKIPSRRAMAKYVAADHALDKHQAKLLAEPENFRRYFRIVNPETGKQARVIPASPQEPASP